MSKSEKMFPQPVPAPSSKILYFIEPKIPSNVLFVLDNVYFSDHIQDPVNIQQYLSKQD